MQDTYIGDEGKGFPLVLVHGFLGSSKMWGPQIDFFKDYFRVITPDLPGFGKSKNAKPQNSIQSMSNLILDSLEEKKIFLEDIGMQEPGSSKLIRSTYKLLNLHTFFTAGKKEVRAWTVGIGQNAYDAAGQIHSDFQKGFICSEVISYNDYINNGSEIKSKEAGKMRLEGKDYIVEDGDIMHFRFNI